MSATITVPADLERRIAEVAAAQGKDIQQIAIEALVMIFDPAEELEDDRTLRALESARRGEGRPVKEALEGIRIMLGIPADAKRPAQLEDYEATETSLEQVRAGKTKPMREFLEELRQEFGVIRPVLKR